MLEMQVDATVASMLGIPNEMRSGGNMRLHRLVALLAITVALGCASDVRRECTSASRIGSRYAQ